MARVLLLLISALFVVKANGQANAVDFQAQLEVKHDEKTVNKQQANSIPPYLAKMAETLKNLQPQLDDPNEVSRGTRRISLRLGLYNFQFRAMAPALPGCVQRSFVVCLGVVCSALRAI